MGSRRQRPYPAGYRSHIKDKAESLLTMNKIKHNVNIEITPHPDPLPKGRGGEGESTQSHPLPLSACCRTAQAGTGERIEVRGQGSPITPKKKLNMIRIMQESLGNIIKHAKATEVDISIKEKDGKITMEIKDNGRGFDSAIIQSKGYGLRNMKNRCDEMGAEFKIRSEIGKGTEIVVEMGG
jgi:signal transduction histidine kinase